jgi:hypothetical protein
LSRRRDSVIDVPHVLGKLVAWEWRRLHAPSCSM